MNGFATAVLGAFAGLVGLLGLFLAAKAADSHFYLFGLIAFAAAVLYEGYLLRRYYDAKDAAHG